MIYEVSDVNRTTNSSLEVIVSIQSLTMISKLKTKTISRMKGESLFNKVLGLTTYCDYGTKSERSVIKKQKN